MVQTRVKIVENSFSGSSFEKDINKEIKRLEDCDATIKNIKIMCHGCRCGNDDYLAMIIYEVR